jgi:hypothetical protein
MCCPYLKKKHFQQCLINSCDHALYEVAVTFRRTFKQFNNILCEISSTIQLLQATPEIKIPEKGGAADGFLKISLATETRIESAQMREGHLIV